MSTRTVAVVVVVVATVLAATLLALNPRLRCEATGGDWVDGGARLPVYNEQGLLLTPPPVEEHCDY